MIALLLSPIYIIINIYVIRWLIRWMESCSKYFKNKISKLISEDKKIYVLYAATPFARFLFDGLFLLDKNFDRRLIDCSEIELNVLNAYFWGLEITKCEFLKPDVENGN